MSTEFRTGTSIRLGYRENTTDNFIGIENGSFVVDIDTNQRYEWIITLNKDLSICFKSKLGGGGYIGIDQHFNVIPNANPDSTGKFKVTWRPNGRISLMSHLYSKEKNVLGKEGPYIGFDQNGYLVGNADFSNCVQWDVYPTRSPTAFSTAAKLLSNYSKHLEMWRGPFTLVQTPTKKVKAQLMTTYSYPNARIKKWVMFMAAPPTPIQSQTISVANFGLYDCRGVNQISAGTMVSAGAHHLFRSAVENPPPDACKTVISKFSIEAQLHSTKLTKVNQHTPVPPLADHVKRYHLQETATMNFKDPAFLDWLNTHRLHPMQMTDGSYEPLLCFAYRVFLFIKVHFNYIYPVEGGRKATDTIATRSTDCGGFCILFSSVMRAHGVPSRLLFGHWAQTGTQYHVKGEFYANGLGWVPFDMSGGVIDNYEPYTYNFGHNTGEFITCHIDDDIKSIETTIHQTTQTAAWLQLPVFWINGEGPLTNFSIQQDWVVS